MNIIQIVENLYVNKKTDWIRDIDESEVEPYVIQHWLAMNDEVRAHVRWLDKYVFSLPPKMYLSLAWSALPKYPKPPFVKYIKRVEEEEEFLFILAQVRKQFKLSDNDYNAVKGRVLQAIKKDMPTWFKYYGVPKRYWKQYYLNFNLIKEEDRKNVMVKPVALATWGL